MLEEGCYRIYAGTSIRDLEQVQVDSEEGFQVERLIVTERLEEACAPQKEFVRLKPGACKAGGIYEMSGENVPLRTVSLEERIRDNMPPALTRTGNREIQLRDVLEGNEPMEAFLAQLVYL